VLAEQGLHATHLIGIARARRKPGLEEIVFPHSDKTLHLPADPRIALAAADPRRGTPFCDQGTGRAGARRERCSTLEGITGIRHASGRRCSRTSAAKGVQAAGVDDLARVAGIKPRVGRAHLCRACLTIAFMGLTPHPGRDIACGGSRLGPTPAE
jgi:excinuclease ABC subunit C